MSEAIINMNWANGTDQSLTFSGDTHPEHGTPPSASPGTMTSSNGNASAVTARSNSSITGPGPEGSYYWAFDNGDRITCDYHHPFDTGETTVQVTCPSGYQVQGCGQGPAGTISLTSNNCSSLDSHSDSNCTISVAAT